MFEPNNEPLFVDPNTDNLEDFTKLMTGQAKILTETEEETPVDTPEPEDVIEEPETPVDDDLPPDEEKEEAPKKVSKVQERINKVLERERLARERAEAAERRIAELEKATEKAPTPVVTEQTGPTPEDKNDDGSDKYPLGEFDPQYIRDLTRHTIQTEQKAAAEKAEQERIQREAQESRDQLQAQWREKLSVANEQYPDFMDKTVELEETFEGIDPQYADYLVQTVKSLDHGTDVLYYFANNLEEAQKFVKLGPLAATLALGEYNAMFKGQTRKEAKVSKAPPPPQVNKGSTTRRNIAADTDSLEDFEKIFFSKK